MMNHVAFIAGAFWAYAAGFYLLRRGLFALIDLFGEFLAWCRR